MADYWLEVCKFTGSIAALQPMDSGSSIVEDTNPHVVSRELNFMTSPVFMYFQLYILLIMSFPGVKFNFARLISQ